MNFPAFTLAAALCALHLTASAAPITPTIPNAARPLLLSAVRLPGGPLKNAQNLDAKYLLALEPDRMLAGYRLRAGLEPKAKGSGSFDLNGLWSPWYVLHKTYAGLRDAWRTCSKRRVRSALRASGGCNEMIDHASTACRAIQIVV
jgi:hypothetical protein